MLFNVVMQLDKRLKADLFKFPNSLTTDNKTILIKLSQLLLVILH